MVADTEDWLQIEVGVDQPYQVFVVYEESVWNFALFQEEED